MKRTLLPILLLSSSFALANLDQMKIATVERIYQEFVKSGDDYKVIKKYADPGLKAVFKKASKYEQDENCAFGFIVDGQDYQLSDLVVTSKGSNQAIAKFKNFGVSQKVIYTLNCDTKSCKVSDVGNLKKQLLQCR